MRDVIQIKHDCVSVLFDEGLHLMHAHIEELGERDLHLQQSVYLEGQAAGTVVCFTARVDQELVGYAVYFCCEDPKHGTPTAISDAIYLHPKHRVGMNGLKLIKYADDHLRTLGITKISCLTNGYDYSPVLKRLGYKQTEVVYTRVTDG